MRNVGWIMLLSSLVIGLFLLVHEMGNAGERTVARRTEARVFESGPDPRKPMLESRVSELESRIRVLESDLARLRSAVRASFTIPAPDGGGDAAPDRFLDLYVRSFLENAVGSDYFRLAVDAHAPLLRDELTALIADASQPLALRCQLAAILGTERFAGDARITSALVGLLTEATPPDLALPVLEALEVVGDASVLPALERYVEVVPWSNMPYSVYETVIALAGDLRNPVLRRWLPLARDDVSRAMILDGIDRADPEGALVFFHEAWILDPPVRAAAARQLGSYRSDEFRRFVADKLRTESDPAVRKQLERAQERQGTIPSYDAMKAAGAPDADPNVDHPNAWASSKGEMGLQWLELSYSTSLRASLLRIFEVNSAGAVVEAQAIDEGGRRHTLWSGSDPTARPGVFELTVPLTPYRVKRVRLVLDTDRRPGWNEIDAVELVGPDGRAWASSAVASSSYGQ